MANDQRQAGQAVGRYEAALFLRATKSVDQPAAYAWLDRIVADGRRKLRSLGVADAAIEIWDNACRIAFLLATVRERNRGLL